MPAEDYQVIEEKLAKGEELTDVEMQSVMSQPNEDPSNFETTEEEENGEDLGFDDEKKEKDEESSDDEDDDDLDKEDEDDESKDKKSDASEDKEKTDEEKAKEESDTSKDKKENDEESKDETLDKVMREIDKPDGLQDLSDFSQKDKGLFWTLKKTRQRARDAEEERDQLKFEKVKANLKSKAKEDDESEDDDEDQKDPNDFVTFADLQKASGKKGKEPQESDLSMSNPVMRNYYIMCEKEAVTQFEDYQEVIECAEELVQKKPDNQKKVAQALLAGTNPAVAMYEAIKADPEFETVLPVAQARLKAKGDKKEDKNEEKKEDTEDSKKIAEKAKADEKKMVENKKKKKTSAHHSGSEFDADEITTKQVIDMSDAEFAAQPKAKRDAILGKFG